MKIFEFLKDFVYLFYPKICLACNKSLLKHEEVLCTSCLYHLPKTNYHNEKGNPIEQLFWGKIKIEKASAYYFFKKGSNVQKLLHKFKYKNNPEIGIFIGKKYGQELVENNNDIPNLIVPIPLHKKKKTIRGYNQSEMFGIGLSESMNIPMDTKNFIRTKFTETQTKKNKFSRWENVKEVFQCPNPDFFKNKHLLLIDDVITTGSTVEASANKLLEIEGVRISIACIATAYR